MGALSKQNRYQAVLPVARLRYEPFGNLLLQRQYCSTHELGMLSRLEQNGRTDVVGEISGNEESLRVLRRCKSFEIYRQNIPFDHLKFRIV